MRPQLFTPPVPVIAISPPPFEYPASPPLTEDSSLQSGDDVELYRSVFLTPPPRISHKSSAAAKPQSKGLEPVCFETLLQASRERTKHYVDLRKEVTMKAHRSKQDERRARFLAKIVAPPSPSATHLPVTPPESPALFHFTLPSPGLVSPLALFESLGADADAKQSTSTTWVEQVEFRCPKGAEEKRMPSVREMRRHSLPSLEDISSHFRFNPSSSVATRPRPPLPAFLYARKSPPASSITPLAPVVAHELAPLSPCPSYCDSAIQATTSLVPRRCSSSPIALTEANLMAFEQRAIATIGLNTLKRRLSPEADRRPRSPADDKLLRRFSAPSQLVMRKDNNTKPRVVGAF